MWKNLVVSSFWITGCTASRVGVIVRLDVSDLKHDCRMPVDELTRIPIEEEIDIEMEYLSIHGYWQDTPFGRRELAEECCIVSGGNVIGWQLVPGSSDMFSPLCSFTRVHRDKIVR